MSSIIYCSDLVINVVADELSPAAWTAAGQLCSLTECSKIVKERFDHHCKMKKTPVYASVQRGTWNQSGGAVQHQVQSEGVR